MLILLITFEGFLTVYIFQSIWSIQSISSFNSFDLNHNLFAIDDVDAMWQRG